MFSKHPGWLPELILTGFIGALLMWGLLALFFEITPRQLPVDPEIARTVYLFEDRSTRGRNVNLDRVVIVENKIRYRPTKYDTIIFEDVQGQFDPVYDYRTTVVVAIEFVYGLDLNELILTWDQTEWKRPSSIIHREDQSYLVLFHVNGVYIPEGEVHLRVPSGTLVARFTNMDPAPDYIPPWFVPGWSPYNEED